MSTNIEWTQTKNPDGTITKGESWNPIRGCSRVSKGCEQCYAEKLAYRFNGPGLPYEGLTRMTSNGPRWTGKIKLVPDLLEQPLRWKRPRKIFVASMSDPNHDEISDEFRDKILAIISLTPHHTYQWLTKRAKNMKEYFSDPQLPFRIQKCVDEIIVNKNCGIEVWRDISGYKNLYQVSSHGRVRRIGEDRMGRIKNQESLKPRQHNNGYLSVCLSKDSKIKEWLVHRLVLTTFRGLPGKGEESRHMNGNRKDNRLSNLLWGTRADNMADAARHGTAGSWMKSNSTLTKEQVSEIRRRRSNGEKLDNIAKDMGSNRQQISAVALNKIFKPAKIQWPLPNLWLGVSVEDQPTANERIPLLLQTPAAVRWISVEPLLGPIDLTSYLWGATSPCDEFCPQDEDCHCGYRTRKENGLPTIDWAVVGGESGPKARPMHPAWARRIRDQCVTAGTPFLFKQWGAWEPVDLDMSEGITDWMIVDKSGGIDIPDYRTPCNKAGEVAMRKAGKKMAGRLLDGELWDQYPNA